MWPVGVTGPGVHCPPFDGRTTLICTVIHAAVRRTAPDDGPSRFVMHHCASASCIMHLALGIMAPFSSAEHIRHVASSFTPWACFNKQGVSVSTRPSTWPTANKGAEVATEALRKRKTCRQVCIIHLRLVFRSPLSSFFEYPQAVTN